MEKEVVLRSLLWSQLAGPQPETGLWEEGTGSLLCKGVPNLSLSENWALGQPQPSGLLLLASSPVMDLTVISPPPGRREASWEEGWGGETELGLGKEAGVVRLEAGLSWGGGSLDQSSGPLARPCSCVRIHYENQRKILRQENLVVRQQEGRQEGSVTSDKERLESSDLLCKDFLKRRSPYLLLPEWIPQLNAPGASQKFSFTPNFNQEFNLYVLKICHCKQGLTIYGSQQKNGFCAIEKTCKG